MKLYKDHVRTGVFDTTSASDKSHRAGSDIAEIRSRTRVPEEASACASARTEDTAGNDQVSARRLKRPSGWVDLNNPRVGLSRYQAEARKRLEGSRVRPYCVISRMTPGGGRPPRNRTVSNAISSAYSGMRLGAELPVDT